MDLRDMWMVEWSEKQGWFHVGNIDEMIGKNIRTYIDGQTTDYVIVGSSDESVCHSSSGRRRARKPGC